MRKLFIINDTFTNKVSYYHLLLFLTFLPFDRFYSELVLASLTVHTLIHFKKEQLRNISWRDLLVLQSIFLLTVLSTVYSRNTGQAFSFWSRQASIFLFPFLLFLTPLDLKKYQRRILAVFAFTCILTILYLYGDAFKTILYYHLPFSSILSSFFINHNFSAPIGLHATYLSLYAAVSLIFLVTMLYAGVSLPQKIWVSLGIAVLLMGLIQLGSRAILVGILLVAAIVLPVYYLREKQRLPFTIVVSLFICVLFIGISRIEGLKARLFDALKTDLGETVPGEEIADPRMLRWEAALALIRQSPIIGHGSGDEVMLLKEAYFRKKLYNSYLFSLNAHNEYLSIWLKSGIVGLAVFLFGLYYGFDKAIRQKNIFLLSFLFLLSIVSVSENFLDVNKGIFFYAFFFSFFLLAGRKQVQKETLVC